jgi:aspartate racemase
MPIKGGSVVGVLGGMGPEATVDLMARVIALTPAQDDADHIHMLINNNPKVPSRIKAIIEGIGASPVPSLIDMAKGLEQQGADYLAMPCNTAHYYYSDIAQSVNIPFINLLEITVAAVRMENASVKKVGLLASSALQITRLYEPVFQTFDITVLYPRADIQSELMNLITEIKAKRQTDASLRSMELAANSLINQGADHLVVACTELSLITDRLPTNKGHTDAADVLAREIVRISRGSSV